jgi:hypothetical protein
MGLVNTEASALESGIRAFPRHASAKTLCSAPVAVLTVHIDHVTKSKTVGDARDARKLDIGSRYGNTKATNECCGFHRSCPSATDTRDVQPYHLRHVRPKANSRDLAEKEETLTHPAANRRRIRGGQATSRPSARLFTLLSHSSMHARFPDSEDCSLPSSICGSSRSPACISSLCSLYSSSTRLQVTWRRTQLLYCGS